MDLERAVEITKHNIIFSSRFPYRTGMLRDNFFDKGIYQTTTNSMGFSVMGNPKIYYGKILQLAPTIRYRIHKVDKHRYEYIRHKNRYFRFIDKIIDEDVVPALEADLGVKRI